MASDLAAGATASSPGTAPASHLVRRDYVPRYEDLLRQHLPARFAGFAPFFANLDRLDTMASMLQRHVRGKGRTILNAGCGPFASEIFVAAFQDQRIVSFDYTSEFAPFYDLFRDEGVLRATTFTQADAMTIDLAPMSFDLIVMHDLLYEPALQLESLAARYRVYLSADGLIYFDYMNLGLRWLWSLLGREKQYHRYDPREVADIMERLGFEIVEQRPVRPSGSRAKTMLHAVLTRVFGTSNAFAVVARRRAAA